ncbi:uncharacterized protein LOC123554535 isoform X2 [Mercenaria mercenaria]|uniref:uncharacterized protein LOC123554535 isoform X2 n=1 Tax=Mercenaria mercenaria TaxID=6596 RepID=UPI00234F86D7|nr:uncharacterized protein LOC123554535 isoform X2 [Mercenaria mercenaria]
MCRCMELILCFHLQKTDNGTVLLNRETVKYFETLYREMHWKQDAHAYDSNEKITPRLETEVHKNNKRSRKSIEVELYDPTPSEATEAFISAFKKEFCNDGTSVRKTTNISDSKTPVLLICNISSRLEADINRVLKSVKETDFDRIVLITLHVKDKHALPQEETKLKIGMQERYCYFKSIVDIAFTQENGLYSCRMNDTAKSEIRRLYKEMLETKV